jgi:hypothetical protein
MAKPFSNSEVQALIEDLQREIKVLHEKVELYNRCYEKGLYGYVDLKFHALSEIEHKTKLIALLQFPERNPQLYIRFDLFPKPVQLQDGKPRKRSNSSRNTKVIRP